MIAPILVQVYNRKAHFVNCIESLAQCRLANETHLFIASDASRTDADKEAVRKIREYCSSIIGFKKVDLLISEQNMGATETYKSALIRIFSEYDKLIYTEDDNIFSINFLDFINRGLDYYENNSHIFSICGYKHPFKVPQNYSNDVYTSTVISAWGLGVWKKKYLSVDFYPNNLDVSAKKMKRMSYCWQNLIRDSISGGKMYADVLMEYHCLKYNMVNIFPVVSLVQNHGNDGSGMHCTVLPEYSKQNIYNNYKLFEFIGDIDIQSSIEKRVTNAIDYPFVEVPKLYLAKIKHRIRIFIKIVFGICLF